MNQAENLSPNSGHYLPSDPDDKGQFGFSWHIVVSHFTSSTAQADFTPVHLPVLLVVLLSPLVDQFPGHFTCLIKIREYNRWNYWHVQPHTDTNSWVNPVLWTGYNTRNLTLPFYRPASSWYAWPSWWRRPFAFSKGSQGPPELFFCYRHTILQDQTGNTLTISAILA